MLRNGQDGRVARVAIFFVEGTTDDPDEGSHEDSFELIEPVALECRRFANQGSDASELIDFLSDLGH